MTRRLWERPALGTETSLRTDAYFEAEEPTTPAQGSDADEEVAGHV